MCSQGASRVSAYVTHAAFSHGSDTLARLMQMEPPIGDGSSVLSKHAVPTGPVDGAGYARLGDGERIVYTGSARLLCTACAWL